MNPSDILSQIFTQAFVAQVAGVVIVVVADLLFGVILALKTGSFDVEKVANFYKTTVLPYGLGWLVLYFLIKIVAIFAIKDVTSILPVSLEAGAFGILMLTLGSGLVKKFVELWGKVPGQAA